MFTTLLPCSAPCFTSVSLPFNFKATQVTLYHLVIHAFKKELKECFTIWYADEVPSALNNGSSVNDIQVNISTSAMKPLQAKWLITVHSKLKDQKDIIQRGFEKGGITSCFCWSDVED